MTGPSETLFGDRPPQTVGQGARRGGPGEGEGARAEGGIIFGAEIPNNRAVFRILPLFNNQTNSRPGQGNPKIADRRPKHALGLRFYI